MDLSPEKDKALAKQQHAKLTGGRTNYYLVRVDHPQREDQPPYQAECEDIIEALGLSFDEANIFKEIWRSANARQLNGKPGHSAVYGAEKIVHYANRILRRLKRQEPKQEPDGWSNEALRNPAKVEDRSDEIRQIATQAKNSLPSPWIEWLGGPQPVENVQVEYRLRRSSATFAGYANYLSWYWGLDSSPNDIVEYRVID